MDKAKAKKIMDQAVELLKKKFPTLTVQQGRCRFTASSLELKVQLAEADAETGIGMTKEASTYRSLGAALNLPPLGTWFLARGVAYKTTGYRSRARKRPVLAVREDGKTFVFPTRVVVEAKKMQMA